MVSAGVKSRSGGMSSNPATWASAGTESPRERSPAMAPSAMTSLTASRQTRSLRLPLDGLSSCSQHWTAVAKPPSRLNSPYQTDKGFRPAPSRASR